MPPTYANGHIFATGDPIYFTFGSRVGFSGTVDLMALFPVRTNPRWRPEKFQMAISPQPVVLSTSCLVIGWGFVDGWSNDAVFDSNKFKMVAAAILDNFEWPYLCNGSRSTYIALIAWSSLRWHSLLVILHVGCGHQRNSPWKCLWLVAKGWGAL